MKNMMVSKILYASAITLLSATFSSGQEFTVSGKLPGGPEGTKIFLQKAGNPPVSLDSTVLSAEGSFSIKGNESDGGNFYMIDIAGQQKVVMLVEGGDNLQLAVQQDGSIEITGSENMKYYSALSKLNSEMAEKVNAWNEEYATASEKKDLKKQNEIRIAYESAEKAQVEKIRTLIPQMGDNVVAVFAANNFLNPETDLELMSSVADKFEKAKPDAKIVQAYVGQMKRLKGLSVGALAPDFTLDSPEGEKIALSSLRGQYVLIDFWASWCGPCRVENPNVVKMYNKYKEKGFTIYGVSLDKDKKAWVNAIEKDKLTWVHGSDLKYWQNEVAQNYGVTGIPATFLLDKDGKIIAKNLRGKALEDKLAELMD